MFGKNAKISGAENKVEFDDRLRFATKVTIQQIIIEKMALIADSPESMESIQDNAELMKLFTLEDWYKVLAMQAVGEIKPEDLYNFPDAEIEALKKKWNLPSIFAEMQSAFIKNYLQRINNSLASLLKPVKTKTD